MPDCASAHGERIGLLRGNVHQNRMDSQHIQPVQYS
jgi:hypothetical protein